VPSSSRGGSLFHARVHPAPIASFAFPDDLDRRHAAVLGFAEVFARRHCEGAMEGSLRGDFLDRVFGEALGYRTTREGGAEVPIEIAPAGRHLDRSGGRAPTPVQRAWERAGRAPGCRFVIVSNYEETRLYSTARSPDVCEVFLLADLATIDGFKRFYYLLARERLLGDASPVALLLAASARAEDDLTRALYAEYRGLREKLFAELRRAHPGEPPLELLGYAQTILDRVLFLVFAEARDLLPPDTLAGRDKADPQSLWHHFRTVFRWIDRGHSARRIPAYGGGLFAHVPAIERLEVSDDLCAALANLGRYDFRHEVSVEVLGHVFEQSISDLEALRRSVAGAAPKVGSKRHDQGVYYTPSHLTRYIVDRTLGRTLTERREAVFDRISPEARPGKEQTAAFIEAWQAYREALKRLRVLDPACGSGAFLVAAYDALGREHARVAGELADLRGGQLDLFDLDRTVLDDNLFGVDVSSESVEITKLSLWLETAQHGRRLTDLDRNVKRGDSIVTEPDPGGFDVVIGNPPYVRHELLAPIKDHLARSYVAYHGMADLYVYFFERGLAALAPGGRLGFIVSNKWLRAGYAAPLRRLLAGRTEIECLVDFGHAPIFEDADTFPCVIALRKLAEGEAAAPDHALSVTAFPRSALEKIDLAEYVASHQYAVPQRRLGAEEWSLEPAIAEALYRKIRERGTPLVDFSGEKPYRGLLTGYNEAFFVDEATRARLVHEDPRSAEILARCLRGQDVDRWSPSWKGTWLICARHGVDIEAYPAIERHLSRFRRGLEPRPRHHQGEGWPGRKPGPYQWYELQDAVDYWDRFARPKIVYQEIQFHPSYGLDLEGLLVNNKTFFLCSDDPWLLAVLNAPLMWWHNWRYLGHMKDEALSPAGAKMELLPIAAPLAGARPLVEELVPQLVSFARADVAARSGVLDALRTQVHVEAPGQKLQAFEMLSPDAFLAEVTKRRPKAAGKLKPADLAYLREVHAASAAPIQQRRDLALAMEPRLSDLVNQAYGLTPDEIALLWATAPPRMPVGR
jgi:Eco57I restriction-modification methylase